MKDNEANAALATNLGDQGAEIINMSDYDALPESGLMQTKSPYSTAVQVIRPRDFNKIEARCIAEAARAGSDFYYSWSQGGKIIEGLTVGASLMVIRNWGNCALDVKVMETPSGYIFYGAFIDLETGFNLVRPFKMSKQSPKNKDGRDTYSGERGKDIIFQIGASKAMRNAALNALPKWLTSKVLDTAKKNVVAQVEKMGKVLATQKVLGKAEQLKIPIDRIEANYGKSASWDIDKIVAVMGALRSVEDGTETMEEVFSNVVAINGEPEFKDKKPAPEAEKAGPTKTDTPAAEPTREVEVDYSNPTQILMRIEKIRSAAELSNWEKKHKVDLEMIDGKEGELIQKSLADKKAELKNKK